MRPASTTARSSVVGVERPSAPATPSCSWSSSRSRGRPVTGVQRAADVEQHVAGGRDGRRRARRRPARPPAPAARARRAGRRGPPSGRARAGRRARRRSAALPASSRSSASRWRRPARQSASTRLAQLPGEAGVAGDVAGVEQAERGLEVVRGDGDAPPRRCAPSGRAEARVPDRVPEPVRDRGDVPAPAVVQEHEVEVAGGAQLAAAVAADGDQRDARRLAGARASAERAATSSSRRAAPAGAAGRGAAVRARPAATGRARRRGRASTAVGPLVWPGDVVVAGSDRVGAELAGADADDVVDRR